MRRYRGLLVALGSAVIAAGALTAPVAAVDPRLALVNGMPGRTVDVCVGTNEVRSNLRYGGWVERFVGPGSRIVRFRAAAPGKCTGAVLAHTVLLLAEDDDKTVVGTRQAPNKVVVFENLPYAATTLAEIRFRHAGDLGPVNVVQSFAGFAEPAAPPPPIAKSQEIPAFSANVPFATAYTAFRAGRARPFHDEWYSTGTGQRQEVILLGTTVRNDKVVSIRRPIPAP
jgi:hypothetical protein